MSALTTNYLTPTGREEAWRFTPLNRLHGLHNLEIALEDRVSLVAQNLPEGATWVAHPARETPTHSQTEDVVIHRVRETASSVSVLKIAPNVELKEPIHLRRVKGSNNPQASRTIIRAGNHSHSVIFVENTGEGIFAEEIEIVIETGAKVTFITLQEWDDSAVHLGRHHAIVGKDASFTSVVITVGGSLVRLLPTVEYSGSGASAELFGLYFATDGQHLEHRVHVDHNIGHAKSRVNYKGALSGDGARTVWIGDVFIRSNAEGTDTYELNRNLLLSDGARADSVPNLEIETGDILGAGHASTTGRFDDEQLFYLQSRGIPEADAKRLVIRGFFLEILAQINDATIEERIMERIDSELSKVDIS